MIIWPTGITVHTKHTLKNVITEYNYWNILSGIQFLCDKLNNFRYRLPLEHLDSNVKSSNNHIHNFQSNVSWLQLCYLKSIEIPDDVPEDKNFELFSKALSCHSSKYSWKSLIACIKKLYIKSLLLSYSYSYFYFPGKCVTVSVSLFQRRMKRNVTETLLKEIKVVTEALRTL